MPGLICEACGKREARKGDIICSECSHYYMILRDLLDEHPELAANELERLKELFQWREKRIQLRNMVTQA